MASTQRVLSGSLSKGSQAILVYPPSLSGTTAIDQYRQGINCRTMDHQYGFIGLKAAPINDPVKIVDGQRMETYRFYNDLDAPSNMAVSSSRPESGSIEASFGTSTATIDTNFFSKNSSSAVGTAATTSSKWVVLGGSDTFVASTTVTVADGDAASGMSALSTITINSTDKTVRKYVLVDAAATSVATGVVLAAGSDYGDDTLAAGHTAIGGIAVAINLADHTQNAYLVQLKAAIEHANGHNGKIVVGSVPSQADGNQAITLTQSVAGSSGNTTITGDVSNVTGSNFTGGSAAGRYLSTVGSHGGIRSNSLQDKVTVKYRVIRGNTAEGSEGVISVGGDNMSDPPEVDEDLQLQIRLDLNTGGAGLWTPVRIHAIADTSATATVTFTGSTIAGEAVTIVSTDETSRVYTFGAAQDLLASPPVPTIGTAAASATSLAACIAAATGHSGKVTVVDNSSGVLTLTQATTGPIGDTTIIETLASGSAVSFIGGGDYGLAAGTVLSVTESLSSRGPGPWSVRWIQTNHTSGSHDTWALSDISIEVNSPIREPAWGVKSLPQLDTSTRSSGLGVAINHVMDQRDLGQALYVYQDGSEYNDLMTTAGIDIVRTPPLNLVVPEMMVDASARSLMDGVMEAFPIRSLADRSSIELPYTARGIRADMCTADVFRQSTLMDQQYDPNEKGVDMYFDGVEVFGLDLLEPTFQAFNRREDDETFADRLPAGATSTGPVTMQGLFAPRTNHLEPFKEGSDAYIRIAGITDEQTRTDIRATATIQFPSAASSDFTLANVSVTDGDAASGMAEGQKVTIISTKGITTPRTRVYRIVDEELSTVATGAVLTDDSDTGQGSGNKSTAIDALKVTGGSVGANEAFTVLVPAAAGGLAGDVTVTVIAKATLSSPSANQIQWHLTGNDATKIANLQLAINGSSDTSKVRFGSGITNGTTVGIQGLTASNGTSEPFARLTADNAGTAGNSVAITDTVGTVLVNESALTNGKLAGGTDQSTADDGDIAVAIKVTGSSLDTQNEFLVQLKTAIEHPKGHGSRITVGAVPAQANGAQVLSLTQASDAAWVNVITEDVANFSVDMQIPNNDGTVTIISTDETSRAYTMASSQNLTSNPPTFTGDTPLAIAISLKACIEAAENDSGGGHGGKITVSLPANTALLTLTQADGGPGGNTTVTDSLTSAVTTSFTGGESGGLADGIMTTALAAMTGSAQDRLKRNHVSSGAGFVYIGMDKGTDSIAFGGLKK